MNVDMKVLKLLKNLIDSFSILIDSFSVSARIMLKRYNHLIDRYVGTYPGNSEFEPDKLLRIDMYNPPD